MDDMTFEEWGEKFQVLRDENGEVRGFDLKGEDWDFVSSQNPSCVWTVYDWEGWEFLVNGFMAMNRQYYLITKIPYEGEEVIGVVVKEYYPICQWCDKRLPEDNTSGYCDDCSE